MITRRSNKGYTLEIKPGQTIDAHIAFMKKYVPDQYSGEATGMHYHRRTPFALEGEKHPPLIEKIKGHRMPTEGKWEFLTRWIGDPEEKWEPVSSFLDGNSKELLGCCRAKKLPVDVVKNSAE